jgi:hypothetical protein
LLHSEGVCYYQNGYREGPEVEVEHVVLGEGLEDAQCYLIEHCIWRKVVEAALDDLEVAKDPAEWWHWHVM